MDFQSANKHHRALARAHPFFTNVFPGSCRISHFSSRLSSAVAAFKMLNYHVIAGGDDVVVQHFERGHRAAQPGTEVADPATAGEDVCEERVSARQGAMVLVGGLEVHAEVDSRGRSAGHSR